jgi:phage-related protein
MGVNTFTFDNETSSTYGVYITEGASYNAPERAVEMLEVPGRNGFYPMDLRRFNNVEVTYHCWVDGNTPADFKSKLSDLRNWLCSRVGYRRLEDSYNPSEYRMAIYKSGLEVTDPTTQSGEFDIVFDCKPQRFLTSGETSQAITSGSDITNPTLFDAHPELLVKGYGTINIGSEELVVENLPIGRIRTSDPMQLSYGTASTSFSVFLTRFSDFNNNDNISVEGKQVEFRIGRRSSADSFACVITSKTNCTASIVSTASDATITVKVPTWTFAFGTSSDATDSTVTIKMTIGGTDYTNTLTVKTGYNGSANVTNQTSASSSNVKYRFMSVKVTVPAMYGDSSKSITNTKHIDLDIGEVWIDTGDGVLPLNSLVQMPAELPVLPPGDTTITYDNTFTSFRVVPRWWKV